MCSSALLVGKRKKQRRILNEKKRICNLAFVSHNNNLVDDYNIFVDAMTWNYKCVCKAEFTSKEMLEAHIKNCKGEVKHK